MERALDMMIEEEGCEEKIAALTYQDWAPLLALIPEIEKTTTFHEVSKEKADKNGVKILSYPIPVPIVDEFQRIVYEIPIAIKFYWAGWDEGRAMAGDSDFDFDSTTLVNKCKLITAIVRNDRFCAGALASAFESGLILKILKSIEKSVTEGK